MKNSFFRLIVKLCFVVLLLPFVAVAQWSSNDSRNLNDIRNYIINLDEYGWTQLELVDALNTSVDEIRNFNWNISRNTFALTNITDRIQKDTEALRQNASMLSNITERIQEDSDALVYIGETMESVVGTFDSTAQTVDYISFDLAGVNNDVYDIKHINDDILITTTSILDALTNLEMPDLGDLTIVMEGMVECCGNVASNTHDIVDVKIELEELIEKVDTFIELVEDILGSLTDIATETTLEAFRNESHDDLIAISNTIAQFVTALYPATTRTGAIDTTSVTAYQREVEALSLTPSMNDDEGVFEQQLDSIDLDHDIVNTNALQHDYTEVLEDYVRDDDRSSGLANSLVDSLDTVEDKFYDALNFLDQIPTQDKLYLHPQFKSSFLKDQMGTVEIEFTVSEDAQDLFDLFWSSFGYLMKVLAICYTSYLILNKVLSEWSTNPLGL